MEFFETIEKRRSVRKYTKSVVPDSVVEKAIDAALLAPNSSNLQPWEFYWVKNADKKQKLVEACFSQGAAATAAHLVVAVSRVDTWRRNRGILLSQFPEGKIPPVVLDYYKKVVPLCYFQDPFGVLGVLKRLVFWGIGQFRPAPRGPAFRSELFEVVTKTTALACQNLMLAITAQGYATCPMEGFDEVRVKKILGLGRRSHVVMVIGIGEPDPKGIFSERPRVPRELVVHTV